MKVNYVPGMDPTLIFYDQNENEAEKIDVTNMDTAGISAELIKRGFNEIPDRPAEEEDDEL